MKPLNKAQLAAIDILALEKALMGFKDLVYVKPSRTVAKVVNKEKGDK